MTDPLKVLRYAGFEWAADEIVQLRTRAEQAEQKLDLQSDRVDELEQRIEDLESDYYRR